MSFFELSRPKVSIETMSRQIETSRPKLFALQDSFSNSKKKTLQQLVDCVTRSCCKSIHNETSQNKNNSTNNPLNANNNINNATIVYYDTPDELENLFNATAESISAAKAKSFNKV
jgi:exonuclease I